MDNEVFQKAVIQELKSISVCQDEFGKRLDEFGTKMDKLETRLHKFDVRQNEFSTKMDKFDVHQNEFSKRLDQFGIRQNEMYLVMRSIEHSNNAGKAQLDSQNLRVSKLEGKFKRVAKVCGDEAEASKL